MNRAMLRNLPVYKLLLLNLLFLAVPMTSLAANDGATTTDMENYFRVIWGLLVVLGIILILYGLLRKRFSILGSSPDRKIHVIEIRPLMGKKALCLVNVKNRQYLLGLSGDTITHIDTMPLDATTPFEGALQNASANLKP